MHFIYPFLSQRLWEREPENSTSLGRTPKKDAYIVHMTYDCVRKCGSFFSLGFVESVRQLIFWMINHCRSTFSFSQPVRFIRLSLHILDPILNFLFQMMCKWCWNRICSFIATCRRYFRSDYVANTSKRLCGIYPVLSRRSNSAYPTKPSLAAEPLEVQENLVFWASHNIVHGAAIAISEGILPCLFRAPHRYY